MVVGFLGGTGGFWTGIGPNMGLYSYLRGGRGVWVGQIGYWEGFAWVFGRLIVSYTVSTLCTVWGFSVL